MGEIGKSGLNQGLDQYRCIIPGTFLNGLAFKGDTTRAGIPDQHAQPVSPMLAVKSNTPAQRCAHARSSHVFKTGVIR